MFLRFKKVVFAKKIDDAYSKVTGNNCLEEFYFIFKKFLILNLSIEY